MKRNSPAFLVLATVSAAAVGCGGGVSLSPEGSVDTGGGSVGVAFAALDGASAPGGGDDDVVVPSPMRGEVDVLVRKDATSWRLFASFFGGGETVAVAGARVGGAGGVVTRNRDGSLALLAAEAGAQHRLAFPVQIYHRIKNGKPVDSTPPAAGVALGDLDGDGDSDAVVAAPGLGVLVLPKLAVVLGPGVNPENPPPVNGYKLPAGSSPSAVATADLDGDGRLDIAALDADAPTLRTYLTQSQSPLDIQPGQTLTLPSPGVALAATGCPDAPLVVTLADGTVRALTRAGKLEPLLADLTPVHHVAASGDALAVDSAKVPGVSLFDACGGGGALLGLTVPGIAAVAMTPADPAGGARELAVLADDGATVSLYSARHADGH